MITKSDDLEGQIRRIRAAILDRNNRDDFAGVLFSDGMSRVDRAASLANVSAHWGIASRLPVIGPFVVIVRRIMRIALRWYINPIVRQQNVFNDAVVAALYDLELQNTRLQEQIAAMRNDISASQP